MKVVILAGKGFKNILFYPKIPKPMIKIGDTMLTHIMRYFKNYGFDDFIIAQVIKK